jgi:hypothetical protein
LEEFSLPISLGIIIAWPAEEWTPQQRRISEKSVSATILATPKNDAKTLLPAELPSTSWGIPWMRIFLGIWSSLQCDSYPQRALSCGHQDQGTVWMIVLSKYEDNKVKARWEQGESKVRAKWKQSESKVKGMSVSIQNSKQKESGFFLRVVTRSYSYIVLWISFTERTKTDSSFLLLI